MSIYFLFHCLAISRAWKHSCALGKYQSFLYWMLGLWQAPLLLRLGLCVALGCQSLFLCSLVWLKTCIWSSKIRKGLGIFFLVAFCNILPFCGRKRSLKLSSFDTFTENAQLLSLLPASCVWPYWGFCFICLILFLVLYMAYLLLIPKNHKFLKIRQHKPSNMLLHLTVNLCLRNFIPSQHFEDKLKKGIKSIS